MGSPEKSRKITVKHYLNKRVKGKVSGGEKYYPLYIQLIVAGQKAQLKSKIHEFLSPYRANIEKLLADTEKTKLVSQGYFSETQYKKIETGNYFPLTNLLTDEINLISRIIRSMIQLHPKRFSLNNFSAAYEHHVKDVHEIIENAVKKRYLAELNEIFLKSTKSEDTRKLFTVTNYFIHFINWNNCFCDYYEITYEVLPSEIKFIENHLSEKLKLDIKALLSFHTRTNSLNRFLGKTENGQLPNVTYIDWLDSGREYITKEFIKIFGKQKAQEYIVALDFILSKELIPVVPII